MVILLGTLNSHAQTEQNNNKHTQRKISSRKNIKHENRSHYNNSTYSVSTIGTYSAFGPNYSQYKIEDPTLRAFIDKSNGEDVRIGKTGIIGEPKGALGFARGHITFYTTSSPTSGTMTGSGAVGTGTTVGSLGSNTTSTGVNGKSPYAGPSVWGTGGPQRDLRIRDSVGAHN